MGLRNRKQFLATVGAGGAALALSTRRKSSAAEPAPAATPAATAAPTEKPISAAALAVAATMRRFDSKLSDAEIEKIARDIDDSSQLGAALNPKKTRLRNSDEPVTTFSVSGE
jgi:hypothetical protein